jgi:hypothetical protein
MAQEQLLSEAKRTYNLAWDLVMEGTEDQALLGLEVAAASLHLWRQVGTPQNVAIGLWMFSRALDRIGARESAAKAAKESLALAEELDVDWLIASALEALTRASRGTPEYTLYFSRGVAAIEAISDADERKLISDQFADLR